MERLSNSISTVKQLWKPINTKTLKMEAVRSPKRRVERVLHGVKFQKTSITDVAVKTSQKTVFFELNTLCLFVPVSLDVRSLTAPAFGYHNSQVHRTCEVGAYTGWAWLQSERWGKTRHLGSKKGARHDTALRETPCLYLSLRLLVGQIEEGEFVYHVEHMNWKLL
jgi:hypothetical protein